MFEFRKITDFPYSINPIHFIKVYHPREFGLPIRIMYKEIRGKRHRVDLPEGSNIARDYHGFTIVLPNGGR